MSEVIDRLERDGHGKVFDREEHVAHAARAFLRAAVVLQHVVLLQRALGLVLRLRPHHAPQALLLLVVAAQHLQVAAEASLPKVLRNPVLGVVPPLSSRRATAAARLAAASASAGVIPLVV